MRGRRSSEYKSRRRIQRWISILAIFVLCITGMDLSAFQMASAEGKSGYALSVEYTGHAGAAVIRGDADRVLSDIELVQITDQNGTASDALSFEYTVTENGSYSFILTYRKTTDGVSSEHQESLSVEVTGIVQEVDQIDSVESVATIENVEGQQFSTLQEVSGIETTDGEMTGQGTADRTETQDGVATAGVIDVESSPSGNSQTEGVVRDGTSTDDATSLQSEGAEDVSDFPESLPIETLKKSAAQLAGLGSSRSVDAEVLAEGNEATKIASAVTKENQISLTYDGRDITIPFTGGEFSEDNVSIKSQCPQRIFYRALFVTTNGTQHEIASLYPYTNGTAVEWYYELKEDANESASSSQSKSETSKIGLGFLLPEGAEIWLEYDLDPNIGTHNTSIKIDGHASGTVETDQFWKINVPAQAKYGEKVVFELNVPVAYKGARVEVWSGGALLKGFRTGSDISGANSYENMTSVDSTARRYSAIFEMPDNDVEIRVVSEAYTNKEVRYYGVGIDQKDTTERYGNLATDILLKGESGAAPQVHFAILQMNNSMILGKKDTEYSNGIQGVSAADQVSSYYDILGNKTERQVAWGQFTVGDDVNLSIDYSSSYPDQFKCHPFYLRFDYYPLTVSDQHEENGMLSELLRLPTQENETLTTILSSGAEVSITCTMYEGQAYVLGETAKFYPQCRQDGVRYQYSVNVKNMQYAFKIYVNAESSLQSPTIATVDSDGIVLGSGECSSPKTDSNQSMVEFAKAQGITGSFFVANIDESEKGAYVYPMTEERDLWGKHGYNVETSAQQSGYFDFYIATKKGYSQPEVTAPQGEKNLLGIEDGYFHYRYKANEYPGEITFSASPINFQIFYRDGIVGNIVYTEQDLVSPATSKSYIIKNIVLDSPRKVNGKDQYFMGYKIDAVAPDGTQQTVDDVTIYSAGDEVNFQDLYLKMVNGGFIDNKTQYTIRIRGVWGDRAIGSQVPAKYNISTQTDSGFTVTKGSTVPTISDLATTYPSGTGGKFDRSTKSNVNGYFGQLARLVGYKEQYADPADGKKYMLSPDSITEGDVTEGNAFAELVYMYAVNVRFASNSDGFDASYGTGNSFGTESALKTFNNSIADRYYIPAENYYRNGNSEESEKGNRLWALELFDSSGVLSKYNPGKIDGKAFGGWKVQTTTGNEWIIDGSKVKWLNIYNIASQAPKLWEEAVRNGEIVLEPVWLDVYDKITANSAGSLTEVNPEITGTSDIAYENFSTTFYYTGKWSSQKAGFKVKLFVCDGSGSSLEEWYSYSDEGNSNSNPGEIQNFNVSNNENPDGSGGTVTVSATIPKTKVRRTILDGKEITVYAWNDKNGVTVDSLYDNKAAKITTPVKIVPQKVRYYTSQNGITSAGKGYTIFSQFSFDATYYTSDEINSFITAANNSEQGKIGYAVFYKSQNYTSNDLVLKTGLLYSGDNTQPDQSSGPKVTLVSARLTPGTQNRIRFEFQVEDSSLIDQVNHNGSMYYIACWIGSDITADMVKEDIKSNTTTYSEYSKISNTVTNAKIFATATGDLQANEIKVENRAATECVFTADFYYVGDWSSQQSVFNVKVYQQDIEGTSKSELYSYSGADDILSQTGGITNISSDGGKVTVTIKMPASMMQKDTWDKNKLVVYAWNDQNGVTDQDSYDTYAAKLPISVKIVPDMMKYYSDNGPITTTERKGYQIITQFKFDSSYYTEGDLEKIAEEIEAGTSKSFGYAVFYNSKYYTKNAVVMKRGYLFDGDNTVTTDISNGPSVTLASANAKSDSKGLRVQLVFQVGSNGGASGSIDMNHSGSTYYIACWNNSEVTAAQVLSDIQNGTKNYSDYSTISNTVTWQNPTAYVSIPSTILLSDQNSSGEYAEREVAITYQAASSTQSQKKNPALDVSVSGDKQQDILLTKSGGSETKQVFLYDRSGQAISAANSVYPLGKIGQTTSTSRIEEIIFYMKVRREAEGTKSLWSGTAKFNLTIEDTSSGSGTTP